MQKAWRTRVLLAAHLNDPRGIILNQRKMKKFPLSRHEILYQNSLKSFFSSVFSSPFLFTLFSECESLRYLNSMVCFRISGVLVSLQSIACIAPAPHLRLPSMSPDFLPCPPDKAAGFPLRRQSGLETTQTITQRKFTTHEDKA